MTDRQQKSADEYIIDCNATRAYKAAYPNVKKDSVARANGSRLLTNANIKNYIEEHYLDETAYQALKIFQQIKEKKLIKALLAIIDISGFDLVERIHIVDKKTRREYK